MNNLFPALLLMLLCCAWSYLANSDIGVSEPPEVNYGFPTNY